MSENGKLTSVISTRASVEMVRLLYDDFELGEMAGDINPTHFFRKMVGLIQKELTSNNWYRNTKMKMENPLQRC